MTEEKKLQIMHLYQKEFPEEMTFNQISAKLDLLDNNPNNQDLRSFFCDELLCTLTEGYVKYDEKVFPSGILEQPLWKLLLENIEKLNEEYYFFWSFYYYLKGQYRKCEEFFHKLCEKEIHNGITIDEEWVLIYFFIPFKNAPDEIWNFVAKEVKKMSIIEGICEYFDLMTLYYRSANNDEVVDALSSFIQKFPDFKAPNEMLGYTYYSMSMWNNAIACFEKVDEMFYFPMADIYWMLAWANGKIKNLTEEERYYRMSLELAPEIEFSWNNLGYCLYKQKKYREALVIFEKCLREKRDLLCAANNYVRVLIALGRNKDAKAFIRSSDVKVSKQLKDKVSKLDNHNARLKKDFIAESQSLNEEESTEKASLNIEVKRHQFANEKLLEDELAAKIENGIPVFGLKLKMYKRKGEYGRQYIIPIGRLDLLCEDCEGNLYIIELKKDSGYDDAYKQTADYLDWFEKSEKFKGKKIYGIICLNSPTEELIKKVHSDHRMKLFEYQISYIER